MGGKYIVFRSLFIRKNGILRFNETLCLSEANGAGITKVDRGGVGTDAGVAS